MPSEHQQTKGGCAVVHSARVPIISAVDRSNQAVADHWTGRALPGFPEDASPTLLLHYEAR